MSQDTASRQIIYGLKDNQLYESAVDVCLHRQEGAKN